MLSVPPPALAPPPVNPARLDRHRNLVLVCPFHCCYHIANAYRLDDPDRKGKVFLALLQCTDCICEYLIGVVPRHEQVWIITVLERACQYLRAQLRRLVQHHPSVPLLQGVGRSKILPFCFWGWVSHGWVGEKRFGALGDKGVAGGFGKQDGGRAQGGREGVPWRCAILSRGHGHGEGDDNDSSAELHLNFELN